MKLKKNRVPRPFMKNLVNNIKQMIDSNEGRLLLLELFEEIPVSLRFPIIEGLSSFYINEMVDFNYLLLKEYGIEYADACNHALEKYKMAGKDITPRSFFDGVFYRAYASSTRHTGRLAVNVAWLTEMDLLQVECFNLTFGSDGLNNFFILENVPLQRYKIEAENIAGMKEIDFDEVCFLISQVYFLNIRNMNRPALGKFLYNKYLNKHDCLDKNQQRKLINKLVPQLTPRQIVNSFFHALRYYDVNYILSLFPDDKLIRNKVFNIFGCIFKGAIFLEGQSEQVYAAHNNAKVKASSVILKNEECIQKTFNFYLVKDCKKKWLIDDFEILETKIFNDDLDSPAKQKVYCRLYEIVDIDSLFSVIDKIEHLEQIEELPYGIHLRLTKNSNDFNQGISFLRNSIAELVINGDELVVISLDHKVTLDLHDFLNSVNNIPVVCRGEYETNVITVYGYLRGQYINFEDILRGEQQEDSWIDGMRFISARYMVKDWARVLDYLEKIKDIDIEVEKDLKICYQFKGSHKHNQCLVEYELGPNWIAVSTVGEHNINVVRRHFENRLYDCLEFDGMEIREEGIFHILTADIKRKYPDLENVLKQVYLNIWYNSGLNYLSGMSPSEACKTEEGGRLLWSMFKRFKQREKVCGIRNSQNLNLHEYIKKIEQEKKEIVLRGY